VKWYTKQDDNQKFIAGKKSLINWDFKIKSVFKKCLLGVDWCDVTLGANKESDLSIGQIKLLGKEKVLIKEIKLLFIKDIFNSLLK